jgi:hypothetical protein
MVCVRGRRWATIAANASLALIVISLLGGLLIFRSAETSAAAGQVEGAIRYREYELESLRDETRALRDITMRDDTASPDAQERVRELQRQMDQTRSDLRSMSANNLHPEMSMSTYGRFFPQKSAQSLLILFLVQILITLYRYSTRVSAFYEARADALQLASEVDALSLKELVDALSADKVDFGKAPVPSSQMAFETIKAALARATEVGAESAKKLAR